MAIPSRTFPSGWRPSPTRLRSSPFRIDADTGTRARSRVRATLPRLTALQISRPSLPWPLCVFRSPFVESCFTIFFAMMAEKADSVTGSPSAWDDLPPELVALVLRRLPTLTDRVRLRAVCRAWRREPLPVPFPWLGLPDETFLNLPDGKVHRFPALLDTVTCHGSVGSWLLLFTHRTGRFSLANPFDGAVVEVPGVGAVVFKLVHLAAPSPPTADSLFAVLTTSPNSYSSEILVCRAGSGTKAIAEVPDREVVDDVAFLDGKLYAMSYRQLYIFDIDAIASKPGTPPRKSIANLVDTRCQWTPELATVGDESYSCKYRSYLVVSGGRLLHVRRLIGYPCTAPQPAWPRYEEGRARTLWFDVFEADLSARFCCPWRRITALGRGQALFVGKYSMVDGGLSILRMIQSFSWKMI